MEPILSRTWLMKIRAVFDLDTMPVSLRMAWLMSRAWMPMVGSPMSPSSSTLGTRAATESTTMMSMAPLRTSTSVISRACSPLSGWLTSSSSVLTPRFFAYTGSRACSASMKAA